MKIKLTDVTDIIRSKNSGPYELTFDIIFSTLEWYARFRAAGLINEKLICSLYKIAPEDIINIVEFTPAKAVKVTIKRPRCSGDPGETDVYGAQQHAPFLDLEFEL
ncbi:MAG: DUF4387 domain-containing protein [Spirochaetaceae bacterium]|jgi:hypothetical protein|nr:DUF4387 domain-containing protein [Spirochaetaceae bacterium]